MDHGSIQSVYLSIIGLIQSTLQTDFLFAADNKCDGCSCAREPELEGNGVSVVEMECPSPAGLIIIVAGPAQLGLRQTSCSVGHYGVPGPHVG